tara:strand:- start:768 stop:932 length:165 start_codon:yes stop_codon:yes gene_type:complete
MNKKEWKEYILTLYKMHLMFDGDDDTFPAFLESIAICSKCIRNKDRCECVEVKE